MEPVSNFVKESVPTYLSNLPIPKTFDGWSKLEVRDWTTLIPLGASVAAVTYLTYKAFCPLSKKAVFHPTLLCFVNFVDRGLT